MSEKEEYRERMLTEPSVCLTGFRLWVLGRQFPNSKDYWDGNWVMVEAECDSGASRTRARGSFIHLPELSGWRKELKKLYRRLDGDAELKCMEPDLNAKVSLNKLGTGTFTVNLTPDYMHEKHQFIFDVDQTHLPPVIDQLTAVLKEYPIKRRIF